MKQRITFIPPDDEHQNWRAHVERGHAEHDVNWGLVIAAMILLALVILFAAAHPAHGATDVPPARRVCQRYRIARGPGTTMIRICVRWTR